MNITGNTAGQEREREMHVRRNCKMLPLQRREKKEEEKTNKHVAQTPVGLGLKKKMT